MKPNSVHRLATRLAALTILAVVSTTVACRPTTSKVEDGRPRAIVLITVDGLSPQRLDLFGGTEAWPSLRELAESGAAWGDAWTASPMTRPGAATYLTGLAPDRHGVRDDRFSALDGAIPTLAERLAEAGYETGAFPDSSFLGSSSGLLRGFALASEPLPHPTGPAGWHPAPRPPEQLVADFGTWVASLPPGSRSFAWLHFTGPLFQQLRDHHAEHRTRGPNEAAEPRDEAPERSASPLERLDAGLRQVEQALAARGDRDSTLILVAGTQASVLGGDGGPAGLGFSLGEPALRVFVVARWSGAAGRWDAQRVAWGPDVPATIAAAAGITLPDEAEGVSLLEPAPADRVCFAWAFAALDQMDWREQRAARSGPVKRVEGFATTTTRTDGSADPVAPEAADRLATALAQRAKPVAPFVDIDRVRPLLEARGLTLAPGSPDGRTFGDESVRLEVSRQILLARHAAVRGELDASRRALASALDIDPQNPGTRLDLAQLLAGSDARRSRELLSRAVERHPTHPELLHWYAHAIWRDSWRDAEALLELIEPFKSLESDVLYDLACTRSLGDDLDGSESFLRRAIDAGFDNFSHMETDPDLRNLRSSGRLSEVLREHR